ncbi:hypothetical protein TNCV_3231381 [Trichonephila clavipes]|nr:hypothetical protein TNCV_3231381 [Trichonephila clavipes]
MRHSPTIPQAKGPVQYQPDYIFWQRELRSKNRCDTLRIPRVCLERVVVSVGMKKRGEGRGLSRQVSGGRDLQRGSQDFASEKVLCRKYLGRKRLPVGALEIEIFCSYRLD